MNLDKAESILFSVLLDIKDYLPNITLVGGWLPYIYSNFLWNTVVRNTVTTVDIDFGIDLKETKEYSKTIFETLSILGYKERHTKIGKMFPVVLYKGNVPIEFITYPSVDMKALEKIVGMQVLLNKIENFDFLLNNRIQIDIKYLNNNCSIFCPKPSAFLYHKGVSFIDRENKEKMAKDLYYMYFILRYAPNIEDILEEVLQYKSKWNLPNVVENIDKYFDRISSQGCILVEQENGQDEYVYNVRQDVFERFKFFREFIRKVR